MRSFEIYECESCQAKFRDSKIAEQHEFRCTKYRKFMANARILLKDFAKVLFFLIYIVVGGGLSISVEDKLLRLFAFIIFTAIGCLYLQWATSRSVKVNETSLNK